MLAKLFFFFKEPCERGEEGTADGSACPGSAALLHQLSWKLALCQEKLLQESTCLILADSLFSSALLFFLRQASLSKSHCIALVL